MTTSVPKRRERIAFAAGVAVIASLMAVVAFGGGVITVRMPTTPSHVTAAR